MARAKSQDKRDAIMTAATREIGKHGLGASTAAIAKEAGISNGSLFTYFETKTDLTNQLYLYLKAGMAGAALEGLPTGGDLREQVWHIWRNWMGWAAANPEKRLVLSRLDVSAEITAASRAEAHVTMADIAQLLERVRANGPMRKVPKDFSFAIMNSLAEATMDFMVNDPTNAEKHCEVGFDALWRMLM